MGFRAVVVDKDAEGSTQAAVREIDDSTTCPTAR